ncbi:LysR family transcriptional regulator [Azorhizobium oxalatiphilum]|uniref:LysR family transcriptional regulator n=1 Tax=Azorhizobium oxalatiphilum TaxID=980631 RepID=A0A917BQN7_9HYPH|nr:LysR substrate-binding domain-containing protein [Azorhizobium oxalatiphilum]GGF55409.1 LysR family transcriptional regulator [Azorhizobium oxalatiphilum]
MAPPRLPLNALRAFEATARLGSMSAAAGELGVTHGAVSRHVRELEAQFGLSLLRRQPKSVVPTPGGAQLASCLGEAFDLMRLGVSRLAPSPLTLSCSATIAMNWLIPRLGGFKRDNPDVEVRLNINYGEVDFVRDEISVAIRSSMFRAPQDVVIRPLLREDIGPVCHPDYAARLGLSVPEDLARARILGTATRPAAWREWLEVIGHPDLLLDAQETYDHFYLLIQAAASGLGMAMAPRIVAIDAIARGHLVAPFGFTPGPHELSLWIAPHLRARSDVKRLVAWIQADMIASS